MVAIGVIGVGTTIHLPSLLIIIVLLNLLLLYTKNHADLLMIVNLVLVK
jgi:hypothetical protein